MIAGRVRPNLEATVSMEVQGAPGRRLQVEAVIDTGFNGFLTLPSVMIASLGLRWTCRQHGLLADGNLQVFDVYVADIVWDGRSRIVEIELVDAEPLVGMSLLKGYDLRIAVIPGGAVTLEALP